jgi:protein TonB
MRKRRHPSDADFSAALPPELRELDRELSAIRIEERPSFGPELEGELLREWQAGPVEEKRSSWPGLRILAAACMAFIMVTGLSVPAARASVARFVRTVLHEAAPALFDEAPEPELPRITVVEPAEEAPSSDATARTEVSPPALDLEEEVAPSPPSGLPTVESSYPEILFRQEAESIIASFYPVSLQRAGVGGAVRLMLWVDADGRVDNIQMRQGSGYRSLNLAAMRAARELRFRPATRAGVPVGTYVEFTVNFVPPDQSGGSDPDAIPQEGPTG